MWSNDNSSMQTGQSHSCDLESIDFLKTDYSRIARSI